MAIGRPASTRAAAMTPSYPRLAPWKQAWLQRGKAIDQSGQTIRIGGAGERGPVRTHMRVDAALGYVDADEAISRSCLLHHPSSSMRARALARWVRSAWPHHAAADGRSTRICTWSVGRKYQRCTSARGRTSTGAALERCHFRLPACGPRSSPRPQRLIWREAPG
jgi:hypothetical protein